MGGVTGDGEGLMIKRRSYRQIAVLFLDCVSMIFLWKPLPPSGECGNTYDRCYLVVWWFILLIWQQLNVRLVKNTVSLTLNSTLHSWVHIQSCISAFITCISVSFGTQLINSRMVSRDRHRHEWLFSASDLFVKTGLTCAEGWRTAFRDVSLLCSFVELCQWYYDDGFVFDME